MTAPADNTTMEASTEVNTTRNMKSMTGVGIDLDACREMAAWCHEVMNRPRPKLEDLPDVVADIKPVRISEIKRRRKERRELLRRAASRPGAQIAEAMIEKLAAEREGSRKCYLT